MTDFNLSEKVYTKLVRLSQDPKNDDLTLIKFIRLEDAMELIRQVKDLFDVGGKIVTTKEDVWHYIDKLLGDEL